MKLYDYYRSTASYRVRAVLAYKGINHETLPVNLIHEGGQQFSDSYTVINAQQLVPSLETSDGILSQSLAIIDYLEDTHPTPSLYPDNAYDKAVVKSLSLSIACDIHPLNNLRVLKYLTNDLSISDEKKNHWYHHWINIGFNAIEAKLATIKRQKAVCFGDNLSVADMCLIPQVYNADRFEVPLTAFPIIKEINDYCLSLDCFQRSKPTQPRETR